ncbi:bifunctional diaminohydroxyphosphoribosylaminopyrimidine deaminase/5-amino-6-(5-phosphoribosylamino)uracil reductase RibD [Marinoscillum furvescens]|uniref:Riboflavin biosynthesis protein RibD n=1 Tax=Marinoscillum furvescens DSM 4134 TaxID=1122208 RepID=A0A3D9L5Z8_MARFU|nr:bifunctional diaminohydroxyphosphoribosylaminopyrimidine deaminase/5-amino-6-(5-phosphoribosylamino)uracil reductase RibD [Marinoscillum furvescens]REE01608.1 diaminohydroxyphosphoribosylaminopyrimidine deaminase [Marinoscillum furvescens DSM 4134]
MNEHIYMRRALDLAKQGIGRVSPNPMVGCVLVKEGKVIGEGYHEQYGGPHAEVNAVRAVKDKSLIKGCTAYVTLEPCAHHGKTPPCADLLVAQKVGRVVICNEDPNPLVAGKGIAILKSAGIRVEVGMLSEEGRFLNRRFFTSFEQQRPYVILKWAQTSDGFVARENFDSKWISNAYSRQLVHKWRAEEDAILVGKNTAKYDNPSLTVRDWHGKHPTRVVIDHKGELDSSLHLFDGSVPTFRFTENPTLVSGAEQVIHSPKLTSAFVLENLHQQGVQSIIVEGGSRTAQDFINAGLWDEARVFTSKNRFEAGIAAPMLKGKPFGSQDVLGDQLQYIRR